MRLLAAIITPRTTIKFSAAAQLELAFRICSMITKSGATEQLTTAETPATEVFNIINVETTGPVVSKEMNKKMGTEKTQRLARPHGGVVSTDNDSKTLSPNSLGSIIGQFKSATTKRIRKECNRDFAWQPRFYDHIIRNEKSLFAIRKHIRLNPLKWAIELIAKTYAARNLFNKNG